MSLNQEKNIQQKIKEIKFEIQNNNFDEIAKNIKILTRHQVMETLVGSMKKHFQKIFHKFLS